MLVKVDNGAVSLAPGAQVDSASFSDVGLAGVGFWSADQNADARQEKRQRNVTCCGEVLSAREVQQVNIIAVPKVKNESIVNVTSN